MDGDDSLKDVSTRRLLRSFSKKTAISKTPYPDHVQPKNVWPRRKSRLQRRNSSFNVDTPRTLLRNVQIEKAVRRSSIFDVASAQQRIIAHHRSESVDSTDGGPVDSPESDASVSSELSLSSSNEERKHRTSTYVTKCKVQPDEFLSPKRFLNNAGISKKNESIMQGSSSLSQTTLKHELDPQLQNLENKSNASVSDKVANTEEVIQPQISSSNSAEPIHQNSKVHKSLSKDNLLDDNSRISNQSLGVHSSKYSEKGTVGKNVSRNFPSVPGSPTRSTPLPTSQSRLLKRKSENAVQDCSSSTKSVVYNDKNSYNLRSQRRSISSNITSNKTKNISLEKPSSSKLPYSEMLDILPSTSSTISKKHSSPYKEGISKKLDQMAFEISSIKKTVQSAASHKSFLSLVDVPSAASRDINENEAFRLKEMNGPHEEEPQLQKQPRQKRKLQNNVIPRFPDFYTRNLLEFYAEMTVSRSAMPLVNDCLDLFWEKTFDTLTAYARHAGRNRIAMQDIELLLYRLRLCHDRNSLNALIEKFLPYDMRAQVIPIAVARNAMPTHMTEL